MRTHVLHVKLGEDTTTTLVHSLTKAGIQEIPSSQDSHKTSNSKLRITRPLTIGLDSQAAKKTHTLTGSVPLLSKATAFN